MGNHCNISHCLLLPLLPERVNLFLPEVRGRLPLCPPHKVKLLGNLGGNSCLVRTWNCSTSKEMRKVLLSTSFDEAIECRHKLSIFFISAFPWRFLQEVVEAKQVPQKEETEVPTIYGEEVFLEGLTGVKSRPHTNVSMNLPRSAFSLLPAFRQLKNIFICILTGPP